MPSKYQYDLESRFPLNTVAITTEGSMTVCTVTVTDGGEVLGVLKALNEDDAVLKARRMLGVADHEPLLGEDNDADAVNEFLDLLNRCPVHDYGDTSGAITIDLSNSLKQSFTLGGNLTTDMITITLPPGPRAVTVRVIQDGTGGRTISADAWKVTDGTINWGEKGAPTFGEVLNKRRFVIFDYWGGTEIFGHYDTNVF